MKIYDPEKTCERIFEIASVKHWTDSDIARKVGITPQAISKWRRSVGSPSVDVLMILSGVLGVSLDELLQYNDMEITEKREGI